MMVFRFFFVLFTVSIVSASSGDNKNYIDKSLMEEIRVTYYAAVEDENKIDELNELIISNFSSDENSIPPIIIAYKAGVVALKSKHAFWPITKLNKLNESMEIFEEAVKLNPENLEIRFMRFSILHYVPSFLGYKKEKLDDLNKIVQLLSENKVGDLDSFVIKGIIEFVIDSERVKEEHVNILKTLIIKHTN